MEDAAVGFCDKMLRLSRVSHQINTEMQQAREPAPACHLHDITTDLDHEEREESQRRHETQM